MLAVGLGFLHVVVVTCLGIDDGEALGALARFVKTIEIKDSCGKCDIQHWMQCQLTFLLFIVTYMCLSIP